MKLIILDQDGVINNDSSAIANRSSKWTLVLGDLEATAHLNKIGRRIDAMFLRPQSNTEKYNCGKSLITMFEEVILRFCADLKNVPIVGDKLRYLRAAEFVGAIPILVLTGKGKKTKNAMSLPKDTKSFTDLASFSDTFIK